MSQGSLDLWRLQHHARDQKLLHLGSDRKPLHLDSNRKLLLLSSDGGRLLLGDRKLSGRRARGLPLLGRR